MDRYFIYLCIFGVSLFGSAYFFVQADAGREMSIPPTNAFSRVTTNGATITANSYDSTLPLNYPYAQISDLTSQGCISGSAKNVTLNSNDAIYRIIHSTSSKTNEIKIQESGVYQIIAVPQVGEIGPGQASGIHDFWLMKNNVKVANTNVKTTILLQVSGIETFLETANWIGVLNQNDIISFQQGCDDSDIGLIFTAAGIPPATPSIIISIARIS